MENSPLANLPPELRNQIYEYAVTLLGSVIIVTVEKIKYQRNGVLSSFSYVSQAKKAFVATLVVGMVCRQMRQEAGLLPWACNTFFLDNNSSSFAPSEVKRALVTFLKTIGPQAAESLRSVRLGMGSIVLSSKTMLDLFERLEEAIVPVQDEAIGIPKCRVSMWITFNYKTRHQSSWRGVGVSNLQFSDLASSLLKAAEEIRAQRCFVLDGESGVQQQVESAARALAHLAVVVKDRTQSHKGGSRSDE